MTKILDSKKIKPGAGVIGGKAQGLLFLEQNKFTTPRFYIINYDTLSQIIMGNITIPELLQNWIADSNIKEELLWAVRSSADNEDGVELSFAGLFITKINIKTDALEDAIQQVLNSYQILKEQTYTGQKKAEFGIILQEMIRSEYSGVIFSHNPFNIQEEITYINIIPGIGENLVSGKEEAFSVTFSSGEFHFKDQDTIYKGQIFSDKLTPIEKSGNAIKKDLAHFFPDLIRGVKNLVELKKYPVDIEFTIANGRIYWLQVRPITTGKIEPIIWDNTASEGNYPGITLPLSISMATNSVYLAYKSMAVFLKMPKDLLTKNEYLLQNMAGEINGRMYYNVSAWQKLIYQLPFGKKISNGLPKNWGMKNADFTPEKYSMGLFSKLKLFITLLLSFIFFKKVKHKYLEKFKQFHDDFAAIDLERKNHSELIEIYSKIETKLGGNWEAPMLNGFFTVLFFSTLKKVVEHSRLNAKYPNFINDILFSQGDVISVLILHEFQKLVTKIQTDKIKKDLFRNNSAPEIKDKLSKNHQEFYTEISNYILKYGDRSEEGELKMETINYKEDPLLFIAFLKSCTEHEFSDQHKKLSINYHQILEQEYKVNVFKRFVLKKLIKQTINRVRDRENFRFMRTTTFSLVRRIFRLIDKELINKQLVQNKGDSMYLLLNEITDTNILKEYSSIITTRKELYRHYPALEVVSRYTQLGKEFKPDVSSELEGRDSIISGIGCSSGVVKGEVKILNDTSVTEGCNGKILVANYFEPGKLNLFSQASGLISVRGNLLSHTAILCREMGIPSIVSARGLLSRIKDGDLIEMNGATGKIKLL